MVRRDLAPRGITDRRVLAAMQHVPREFFVGPELNDRAYADRPLAIGSGQTISQPYMVALMCQSARLTRRSRVLEVGTGSGYHAAVLAHLVRHVWTMERIPELAATARRRLAALDVRNVSVLVGDGTRGYPPSAPYDAILVAAATRAPPPALVAQLDLGGRAIVPVGPPDEQRLLALERTAGGIVCHDLGGCVFVPLVPDDPRT
jgi:protein-L-isoaspartate(D-aspartate) O-methyltransferase